MRFKPLIVTASIALGFPVVALGLIASQFPSDARPAQSLNFGALPSSEGLTAPAQTYTARDGTALPLVHLPAEASAPLVVVLHGSGWHGGGYRAFAEHLNGAGFEVVLPDLRGHGFAPARRGDIDYIGQFEDDLADLIAAYRGDAARPVYLVGHSSGGGLAIRFAGGAYGDTVNRSVLIAPFLHHSAPTARDDTGGWTQVLLRRVIGLSILNGMGIGALNHLTAIQFNFPDSVLQGPLGASATTAYSYRLMTGFAPRSDYTADIAALPPFLMIAGREDEAFHAQAYEPTMAAVTENGSYSLLEGADHMSILTDPRALTEITAFLRAAN